MSVSMHAVYIENNTLFCVVFLTFSILLCKQKHSYNSVTRKQKKCTNVTETKLLFKILLLSFYCIIFSFFSVCLCEILKSLR
jgi:hypothetical protein